MDMTIANLHISVHRTLDTKRPELAFSRTEQEAKRTAADAADRARAAAGAGLVRAPRGPLTQIIARPIKINKETRH